MEKSTSYTFLFYSETENGEFKKLLDITSYPDVFTAPERLDISDLSDNRNKYYKGREDTPEYEFECVYDKTQYDTVKKMEDDKKRFYQIRFGKNGEYGAWQWSGTHFITPTGGGVGDARKGKLVCYNETPVTEVTIAQEGEA